MTAASLQLLLGESIYPKEYQLKTTLRLDLKKIGIASALHRLDRDGKGSEAPKGFPQSGPADGKTAYLVAPAPALSVSLPGFPDRIVEQATQ